MDFLERLNRRFGGWYDGLFGAAGGDAGDGALRPKDILRRILSSMEDGRREGLDGQVYVPNAYTLRIAVASDAERDYLKAFLSADELAGAVARAISQHGYKTRGGLLFVIEEAGGEAERVAITCRFDTTVPNINGNGDTGAAPAPASTRTASAPPAPVEPDEDEPGTVAAVGVAGGGATLGTLLIRSADGRSLEAFPLTPRGAVIGRSRQGGNDIVLSDPQVSKRHARIVWERGGFVFTDENSTNGSRVDDIPALPGVSVPVGFGSVMRVGDTTLTLRAAGGAAPTPFAPAVLPLPGVRLSLVDASGVAYRLASEMVIGRSATADMTIAGAGISDKHARLRTAGDHLTVEDLNTPGGTLVNGERIPPLFPVALRGGDEIAFGGVPFTVWAG